MLAQQGAIASQGGFNPLNSIVLFYSKDSDNQLYRAVNIDVGSEIIKYDTSVYNQIENFRDAVLDDEINVVGRLTSRLFKITPDGVVQTGNSWFESRVVRNATHIFVSKRDTDNAYKIYKIDKASLADAAKYTVPQSNYVAPLIAVIGNYLYFTQTTGSEPGTIYSYRMNITTGAFEQLSTYPYTGYHYMAGDWAKSVFDDGIVLGHEYHGDSNYPAGSYRYNPASPLASSRIDTGADRPPITAYKMSALILTSVWPVAGATTSFYKWESVSGSLNITVAVESTERVDAHESVITNDFIVCPVYMGNTAAINIKLKIYSRSTGSFIKDIILPNKTNGPIYTAKRTPIL